MYAHDQCRVSHSMGWLVYVLSKHLQIVFSQIEMSIFWQYFEGSVCFIFYILFVIYFGRCVEAPCDAHNASNCKTVLSVCRQ